MDRRIIYIFVALSLALPLLLKYSLSPVPMKWAEKVFDQIETLERKPGSAVLISLDFGPNSQAENLPQAEVLIEHLMRLRQPFVLFSQYPLAEGFLESIPDAIRKRLRKEYGDNQDWVYGIDWVNLGYRPNSGIMIQNIAQSKDIPELLKKDARGNILSELELFKEIKTIENFTMLVQLTSLVGTLDSFLQFFQSDNYRPKFVHGCTSITIPQAFIYLDSGQLVGLLEGVAGAAWYSKLLSDKYTLRPVDSAVLLNTSLGVAHLLIIFFVILGNLSIFFQTKRAQV